MNRKPRDIFERQQRLRRLDAWLNRFRQESPVLFMLFFLGIGGTLVGLLLQALDWLGAP